MIRRYFTLEDVLSIAKNQNFSTFRGPNYFQESGFYGIYEMLNESDDNLFGSTFPEDDDEKTAELMKYHIYPRFCRSDVFFVDFDIDDPMADYTITELIQDCRDFADKAGEFIGKCYAWMKESQTRYEKIISAYNTLISKITKGLTTESKSRSNTNPQSDTSDDPWDASFTDSATYSVSDADDMNALDKLNEIRNKIYSTYSDWATEFRKFIVRYK